MLQMDLTEDGQIIHQGYWKMNPPNPIACPIRISLSTALPSQVVMQDLLQEGRAKRKARSTGNVVGNQWMGLKLNAQRAAVLPLLSMWVIVKIWHFHLSMLVTFTLRKLLLPVHQLRKLLKRLLRVTMIMSTLAAQVVQLPVHLTVMR
jgi:hypothetical protein